MTIKYSNVRFAAILYAAVPVIIFFFGWHSIVWAVFFSLLLSAGIFFYKKSENNYNGEYAGINIPRKSIIAIAVISILWCFLAGQGDFIHQSNDHIIRDAIFHDLIKKDWPVTYNDDQMLSYYIAHWMLPAIPGKIVYLITGSSFAGYLTGNIALLLWSSTGCFITLILVTILTARGKKIHPAAAAFIFIMFSGIDAVGCISTGDKLSDHLEWWAIFFQFSSITTCLFWVYNQSIVSWIMTLCIINEKKAANFALLGMLILPYGPFPFIGTLLICIVKAVVILTEEFKKGEFKKALLRDTLTLQNIFSVAALAPIYLLYYSLNAVVSNNAEYDGIKVNTGLRLHDVLVNSENIQQSASFILILALFLILEAGVFWVLIYKNDCKKHRTNTTFYISSAILIIIPLIQVGKAYDFSMRVSMPFLIYICVEFIGLIMENYPAKGTVKNPDVSKKNHIIFAAAILTAALGSVTAITEFSREISKTISSGINLKNEYYTYESLDYWEEKNNFSSSEYKDSVYYKVFLKK